MLRDLGWGLVAILLMWFHGTGDDRTGLIGHGPSEADVLAVVRGEDPSDG